MLPFCAYDPRRAKAYSYVCAGSLETYLGDLQIISNGRVAVTLGKANYSLMVVITIQSNVVSSLPVIHLRTIW